ncbi:uncharacterized protein [Amphiura filiformis]|uniref:uncharacterized protein n=1 Tax=Amphiura filiformis TaxID=82378 RepID=UPI003B20B88D
MATKLTRRLEFLERKSARFRNHLHFTLHCKHQGTPNSLKLKSSVKGITAERILERAQHQLDKNVQNNNKQRSIVGVTEQDSKNVTDRWVVNKCDKVLTSAESSVLKKGLNFAVSPTQIPVVEFITGIETATKAIGHNTDEAARLRLDCIDILDHAKVPESNITKEERSALRDLKSDRNITILPADKGRSTVVLNTATYKEKASELLSDGNTYENIKKEPTTKYKTQLVDQLKALKEEEAIDFKCYKQLYPTTAVVPKFYGLPKVHKPACPLRPIVASRGSITYNTAKYIANILSPLVGKSSTHLKNSEELVNKLSQFKLSPSECLVSYDVTALFTSVPVEERLVIVKDLLTADDTLDSRTDLNPQQVTDLLSTCLKTTYFIYDGKYYIQREGAAMGSPTFLTANSTPERFSQMEMLPKIIGFVT